MLIVYGVQRVDEALLLEYLRPKDWQKWTRGYKVMALRSRGEGHFTEQVSMQHLIAYFRSSQKILKYYFVAFRVTRWFVKLKMAISKQFKSLNLNPKNEKVIDWWSRRGQNEEKWKKKHFVIQKNVFLLVLFFFGCSFGFALQRWPVELEKALL